MKLRITALTSLPLFFALVAQAGLPEAPLEEQQANQQSIFALGTGKHVARGEGASSQTREFAGNSLSTLVCDAAKPTRGSFIATWQNVADATGYRLDVSTSESFDNYLNGYRELNVGNVTNLTVVGLNPGTTYYYRVRAYNALKTSADSGVMSVTTAAGAGLVINPTFDISILGDPNSVAIQVMINQAIALYESLFSDPITVSILFRYSATGPDGAPLGLGALAQSNFVIYTAPWNSYIAALIADATTVNDVTANASLPPSPLSTNLLPSSADGRAVGLNTPPAMFADGSVGVGGPYDGIVTLNSTAAFQFNRPPSSNEYDALRTTEHEIDEVLGLGSYLNVGGNDLRPQDLFSWSAPGNRSLSSFGARYFSINFGATNIVGFNQDPIGDFGDWLSESCPQQNPYVQNAFACTGQDSDVAASSPEGINLDVIGYNLAASPSPTPSPTPTPAHPYGEILNPSPGSTFSASNVTFTWSSGTAATAYLLLVGDQRVLEPGGFNIFNSGQTGGHSISVSNIPNDGRTIYVRLWSHVGGAWYNPPQDYTYSASASGVSAPIIAPASGTYKRNVTVNIATTTPGATIYYTTNGTAPTTASTKFSSPFTLSMKGVTTVKAIAIKAGVPDSVVTTASYTIKPRL